MMTIINLDDKYQYSVLYLTYAVGIHILKDVENQTRLTFNSAIGGYG
jgi:hypothetical protein